MVKQVLQIGEPILNQETKQVTNLDDEHIRQIITDLLDTCKQAKAETAGLAAPQIGYDYSICVCRRTDLEEDGKSLSEDELWQVLINPQINGESDMLSEIWEACLSIGEGPNRLYGPVLRPKEVEVSFLTPTGQEVTQGGDGFFSHLLQHEIDHLHGTLFLNYISNPENLWKSKDLDDYLDKHDQYPPLK